METNPILAELQGLSPGAQQALLQAHGATAGAAAPGNSAVTQAAAAPAGPAPMRPPQAAAPAMGMGGAAPAAATQPGRIAPMLAERAAVSAEPAPAMTAPAMGGGGASVPMMTPGAPAVMAPRGTIQGDQAELTRKLDTGSGISQIAGKVENSSFGQAHPLLGKVLGGGAQGLATIGNAALNSLLPGASVMIPGTDLHHDRLVKQDRGQLASDVENQEREAQTGTIGANTARTQAETAGMPLEQSDKHQLTQSQIGNLESETEQREHPQPQYEVHDTANGPLFVNKQTGAAQHLSVDGLPVGPKIQTKAVQLEVGGKPHQVLVNDDSGEVIKDLGPSGIKPPTVNVNSGDASLDRETKRFAAPHEKAIADSNGQLEKIADARGMISGNAEAQAVGLPKILTALVSGAGSGLRITQPELNAIATARGVKGDFEGFMNNVAGKGKLTPAQQQQLTGILDDVKARIVLKQNLANDALDRINGARSRDEVIQADRDARQKMTQLEQNGYYEGQTKQYQGHSYQMGADKQWHLQQ